MDKFVRLDVVNRVSGSVTERWFNIRYIKSVQPGTNSVLMHGANGYFFVTAESMWRLMAVLERESAWVRLCSWFSRSLRRLLHR